MSHCLNPHCPTPQNPAGTQFCLTCGSKLLLRERYRPLKPIGRGGFGRTFLAVDEDKPSKPRCVIKQFFPQSSDPNSTQKAIELFNREAQRLDELGKHPQIPELLAHFQQEGRQYLVQEFIDGENLAQELARTGPFSEPQIQDLLAQLLPVLQFIHEHRVIHRDIKPENIIRRQTPASTNLVLVDFGAAKVLTGTALAGSGTIIGSPEYVAPEQIRGQAVFASDLYSLGVTCLHLLTQLSPFDLFDVHEDRWVWRDFLSQNAISSALGQVLDRLLQMNPGRRYASAVEVLKDLPLKRPEGLQPAPRTEVQTPFRSAVQASLQTQTSLSTGRTQKIQPLRAPTWRCVSTLTGHLSAVTSVGFSLDGETLASGSEDKTIEIWKREAGKRWYTLTGHTDWVTSLAFSPDGQTLASSGRDKMIHIWDMNKGKWWYALVGHTDRVYGVAFRPDSQLLASAGRDQTVQLWNLQKGKWQQTLKGHTDGVETVAFSGVGDLLASGGRDQTVRLWDAKSGQELATLTGHTNWVRSLAFSPNGEFLASGGREGVVKLWRTTGQLYRTPGAGLGDIYSVAFSPDGQWLAAGGREGAIYLWDTQNWTLLEQLSGHTGDVLSVAFSRDGRGLASASADKTVKIWQV